MSLLFLYNILRSNNTINKVYDRVSNNHNHLVVVGYSTQNTGKGLCYSIETAILSDITYSLHTTYNTSALSNTNKTISPLIQKVLAYHDAINDMDDNQLVLFADAFDVIFQGNLNRLMDKINHMNQSNEWNYSKTVLYNAEANCHPFNIINDKYKCILTQGKEYLMNDSNHKTADLRNSVPKGCNLQILKAPETKRNDDYRYRNIYMNSGVSIGTAGHYRKIFKRAIKDIMELPQTCLEDQGILAWLYASNQIPVSLDYNSTLLSTTQLYVLSSMRFNDLDGTWKNIHTGNSPNVIHFAGSKRALEAYWWKIRKWYRDKVGTKEYRNKLKKAFVNKNGYRVPYHEVCPEEDIVTLWNSLIIVVDKVLKKVGLSPQRPVPDDMKKFMKDYPDAFSLMK